MTNEGQRARAYTRRRCSEAGDGSTGFMGVQQEAAGDQSGYVYVVCNGLWVCKMDRGRKERRKLLYNTVRLSEVVMCVDEKGSIIVIGSVEISEKKVWCCGCRKEGQSSKWEGRTRAQDVVPVPDEEVKGSPDQEGKGEMVPGFADDVCRSWLTVEKRGKKVWVGVHGKGKKAIGLDNLPIQARNRFKSSHSHRSRMEGR